MTPDLLKILSNIADNKMTINVKVAFEDLGIVKMGGVILVVGISLLILKHKVFK